MSRASWQIGIDAIIFAVDNSESAACKPIYIEIVVSTISIKSQTDDTELGSARRRLIGPGMVSPTGAVSPLIPFLFFPVC